MEKEETQNKKGPKKKLRKTTTENIKAKSDGKILT